jgi:peptidoglycan/LPS O-acetylase OafA/YrhL
MRGLAAVAVLLHHAALAPWGVALAPHGYLAVDFFFALSGFVIAAAYEGRLLSGWTFADFMLARVLRLYPLLALGLAFGLGVGAAHAVSSHEPERLPRLLAVTALNAFLFPAPLLPGGHITPLNLPAWSLLFELLVNAIYAAFVSRLSARALSVIAALSGVTLAVLVLHAGTSNTGYTPGTWVIGLTRAVFAFSLGVMTLRAYPRLQAIRLPSVMAPVLLAGALLTSGGGVAFDLLFILVGVPALLIAGSCARVQGMLGRLCGSAGAISYPIYAVHYPFLVLAVFAVGRVHMPGPLALATYLFSMIALGLILARADGWVQARVRSRIRFAGAFSAA